MFCALTVSMICSLSSLWHAVYTLFLAMATGQLSSMGGWYTQGFSEDYVNARGIPRVEFVDDVAAFLKKKDCNPEGAIKVMQEQYSKYKLMEYKLGQNKASLLRKLPEIKKTLEMVKHLKAKVEADEELRTHFGLSDTVFVEAVVKDKPQTVNASFRMGRKHTLPPPISQPSPAEGGVTNHANCRGL